MKLRIIAFLISIALTVNPSKPFYETVVGTCLDENGNGVTHDEPPYNYISYASVSGLHKGDKIITYLFYEEGKEDPTYRADFVLGKERLEEK